MHLYYDQAITAIENRTAEEKVYVFDTFEDLYNNQIKIIENVDTTKSNELEADVVSNHHIFIGNYIFHTVLCISVRPRPLETRVIIKISTHPC